jgi:RNA polymerase sigma factor (TIGR02999 family)
MSEVTRILSAIEHGDPHAADQLLPLVYDELRKLAAVKMAHEKPGQTLDATALVHEAYVRLVEGARRGSSSQWTGRAHFFAAAAEAMRHILVDRARRKKRAKHGGGRQRVPLESALPQLLAELEHAQEDDDQRHAPKHHRVHAQVLPAGAAQDHAAGCSTSVGVYNLGDFDAVDTAVAGNHASTSNDDIFP